LSDESNILINFIINPSKFENSPGPAPLSIVTDKLIERSVSEEPRLELLRLAPKPGEVRLALCRSLAVVTPFRLGLPGQFMSMRGSETRTVALIIYNTS
jgi:hypothetical protein